VIDLLADEFVAKHGVNVRKDPYALEKLKFAAENAKRALSVEDVAEIRIPDIAKSPAGESLTLERTLTTREFSTLVGDLVQRTFKVCDEALGQAGLVPRDLDGVILVGGPTRLPLIRESVSTYFGQPAKTDVDPDQVVAMGAAIHASTLVDGTAQDAFLLDVTPLSLRIGVAGGLAETVIERNTPVPIEQTRSFTTYQDYQESVKIRVYQGESRKADENELLGQFEFGGLRKARRGQVRIDVTFSINSDGLVNVTARDRETGRQASTAITLSSGLSKQELDKIVAERKTDRVGGAQRPPAPAAAPEAAAGPGDELEVLESGDVNSLLEADFEALEVSAGEAITPLGDDLAVPLAGAPPDEQLFEESDLDLSAEDTQGTREG
jgi:molecular chaperone DnaK